MIEIIRLHENHVAEIAKLEKQFFSAPWDENSVRSEITNPLALWLVAVENGEVLGYIGSQTVLQEADMMNVAVAEQHRRRGIARMLVEELIRQLDAYQLTLEVRASNAPAISLYESMDFTQVGLRKNYYRSPKEDALILRKEWSK
ncbi:MAG: ribosomal protein S18-alanine N-acetyltransferase [Oscillospiraceae bacterium]|nr:ribosomal protein S18-alanine N-acetyltransferase [Oscillospiraceae bacterium]